MTERSREQSAAIADVLADLQTTTRWQEHVYKQLHADPELSFQETKTAALAAAKLKELGYEVLEGIGRMDPFDWAVRFEGRARELLLANQPDPLIAYETLGRDAALSIPTPDHYLPLLYVIAQRREGDEVSFPVEGFDGGSVSMLTVQIG